MIYIGVRNCVIWKTMMSNAETGIQNEILIALSESGYLANRQHVGTFRAMRSNAMIKVGVVGMADIAAVVPVTITPDMVGQQIGAYVEIEVKTLTGTQRQAQKLRELAVNKHAAKYIIARSPAEALDKIAALYK